MPEFANTYVYVNVVGIRDSGNDCALLLSRYDTNISYLAWRIHEAKYFDKLAGAKNPDSRR